MVVIKSWKGFHVLRFILLGFLFVLASCASTEKEEDKPLPLVLKPSQFRDLPSWQNDDHGAALVAFARSCERILKRDENDSFGPDAVGGVYGDWQPACRELPYVQPLQARAFFEKYFAPWQASAGGEEEEGLFTGYYEPSLKGALQRQGPYQHPLYALPEDLVMVDLGQFRDDLKGQRIAGRVKGAYLKPYEDRAQITAGNWPHNDRVLAWVDDPVDSFFLHIQGSGTVFLYDGGQVRVGYAGQNGHVYYAIGRELIKRGYMEKEEVSLQSIRRWLEENPSQANEIMNLNKSYVFFQILEGDGPLGGEGVALTAGRSLAVDHSQMPYGAPVWVDIKAPVEGEKDLKRLMIAQDTGGAIRGAVRGDVFWGAGERAAYLAGHMKSKGRYWILLPRKLRMASN